MLVYCQCVNAYMYIRVHCNSMLRLQQLSDTLYMCAHSAWPYLLRSSLSCRHDCTDSVHGVLTGHKHAPIRCQASNESVNAMQAAVHRYSCAALSPDMSLNYLCICSSCQLSS